MAKSEFTFHNYCKELKKSALLLIVFLVLGIAAGIFYCNTKPTTYSVVSKISIHNAKVDNGAAISPYTQIADILGSKKLAEEKTGNNLADYTVTEVTRGIFEISATGKKPDNLKQTVESVSNNAGIILASAYDDAEDYRIAVLQPIEDAKEDKQTMTSKVITTGIIAFGMLVLAAVVVFVKFDYKVGE